MTLTGCRGGIGLNASSGNHVKENLATDNQTGLLLQVHSHANHIQKNTFSGNLFQGLLLNGFDGSCDGNHLSKNECSDNGIVGIWLNWSNHGNHIEKNSVLSNRHHPTFPASAGIVLGFPLEPDNLPEGNKIVGNTILDNVKVAPFSWDVFDNNIFPTGDCVNLWKGNVFDFDHEVGADAGPGAGCLQ